MRCLSLIMNSQQNTNKDKGATHGYIITQIQYNNQGEH